MIRAIVPAIAAAFLLAAPVGAQPRALLCDELGKPSYTATRTVRDGRRVISREQVYIRPGAERTERRVEPGKEISIVNEKGRYVWLDGRDRGVFFPKPPLPRIAPPQIKVERVGANTRLSEIVPANSGRPGVGSTVLCSPQGVVLQREIVWVDQRGRTNRTKVEHSSIRIQRLPRTLFQPPREVRFETARGS